MNLPSNILQKLIILNAEAAAVAEVDPVKATGQVLEAIAEMVDARYCFVVFGVKILDEESSLRDGSRGWRPIYAFYHGQTENQIEVITRCFAEPTGLESQAATVMLRDPGVCAAYLVDELVGTGRWADETQCGETVVPLGIRDRIVGLTPISDSMVAIVNVDRSLPRPYGPKEKEIVQAALLTFRWLFSRLVDRLNVEPDLPALSRRQLETLGCLLEGRSEKAAALELGISVATARDHIRSVYQKFGVSSRRELMAHFVAPNVVAPAEWMLPLDEAGVSAGLTLADG